MGDSSALVTSTPHKGPLCQPSTITLSAASISTICG